MKSYSSKEIPIKELKLWDENARFSDKYFQKTENELIDYFCLNKKFKIVDLATDMVADFDIPQVEKLIVYETPLGNIAIEGNRRLAVFKLLCNPELTSDGDIKKKFVELSSKISISEDFKLECVVTEDIDKGYHLIERKHTKSNNEVSWGDNERAHHNSRRGKANQSEKFKVSITKSIKELDIPEAMKESVLGPGFVTSFWRVIDSSSANSQFGFSFDKSGNNLTIKDPSFENKLKVVITDILQKETFNNKVFSRLNKNEIKEYLEGIDVSKIDEAKKIILASQKKDLFDNTTTELSQNSNKIFSKSNSRDYLIPKTCRITIGQTKINNIYRELKDDLLLDDSNKAVPNAVGVLFRVFLEVSLDHYAENNGSHFFSKDTTINKKIEWVVNNLLLNGHKDNLFSNIRKVSSSSKSQSYLSIEHFHEYVHSSRVQPSSNELKAKWDNLQEFFQILWSDLNSQKK